jgi:pimeloyl-ACP methyl ester carboxylesterase
MDISGYLLETYGRIAHLGTRVACDELRLGCSVLVVGKGNTMPHIQVNGARLYYEQHGQGVETVVFGHGLMWTGRMFQEQVRVLQKRYRCITFDFRGQGRSEVTSGGYEMDQLTEDAAELIRTLDCSPCHFVGLSMGGYVGLRLAIRRPELLRSLALLNTSADAEPQQKMASYRRLAFVTRWFGLRLVAHRVIPIMFGPRFIRDPERADFRRKLRAELLRIDRCGVTRALRGVVSRSGVQDQLDRIRIPALVIVGEHDRATPPDVGERIHQGIAASRLVVIPGAGHTSTIEEPEAVSDALTDFLSSVSRTQAV